MSDPVDYIIVGQGLAGSALAWELMRRGKRIRVYDEPANNHSSVISAGICNPITGKVMTKTYRADHLFPFLNEWYTQAEQILAKRFFYPMPIYRPFLSAEERQQWMVKAESAEIRSFIAEVCERSIAPDRLNDLHGGLMIRQSGYLDVVSWVDAVRAALRDNNAFAKEHFAEDELQVGESIAYKDVRASKIIFCNGLSALQGRWFSWLPLRPLKGETLTIRASLDPGMILSRGAYVVPARERDTFIAGSTYQHEPFHAGPSIEGKEQIRSRIATLLKQPFEVVHQGWGIRPTVSDRRPLLGGHPEHGNVIIFNGMGTKGVSLTPYFAKQLADWMGGGAELPEEVNISRFKPLYSK